MNIKTIPNYNLKEVLKYFNISFFFFKKRILPLLRSQPLINFTNLVEIHFLTDLMVNPLISIAEVKSILDNLETLYNGNNPLMVKQFADTGIDKIIVSLKDSVCTCQLLAIKYNLLTKVNQVHYQCNFIDSICFLLGDITINPYVNFGKPYVTFKGIPTYDIYVQYKNGDSIELLADDYDCTIYQIQQAIKFESNEKTISTDKNNQIH